MTEKDISRTKKLPLHIRSAFRENSEEEFMNAENAVTSGVLLRPVTGKVAKAANAIRTIRGISSVSNMNSQLGGTLPRHFDILRSIEPPGALDLMTEAYLMSATTSPHQPNKSIGLPPVRAENSTGASRAQKVSGVHSVVSISKAMHLMKNFRQQPTMTASFPNPAVNTEVSHDQHFAAPVRNQVILDVCHSAGMEGAVLDSKGDILTSVILQVPVSFRENSVKAMQLNACSHDSAEAKVIADKYMKQAVPVCPQILGQQVPFPTDFLKPLNLESQPMNQSELDDPTILLLQGTGITLTREIPLPDGCTVIQKNRKDGKSEIRIDFGLFPVQRSEAQRSLVWFLNQWKNLEDFDSDRSLSNVQTAWTILSVSFMDIVRQNFLICKERGVHLQHLWVHLSSFACRGIMLAQTIACDFAASEVKYLQKIKTFEESFTSEVDKLHKFYQKQLNLAWITEERYKTIIMGLEKDKEDLNARLLAVSESALYNELAALRTFYLNFAEKTKFLRDMVIDATTDWSKRASHQEQRRQAKDAGEIESVEKISLTIGEFDQQDWELKLNESFASKEASDRDIKSLRETKMSLTAEVSNLRDQLEQALSLLKQSKLVSTTSDFSQQVNLKDFEEDVVIEDKKKKHAPKVVEKEKIPQVGLGSLLSLKARPDKPNIMGQSQMNKLVFELYDLKTAADKVDDSVSNFRQNMVQYFFEAYTNKFGLQTIADKQMWNFIASIQKHQTVCARARLIGRFLGVVEPALSMSNLNFFLQFRQRVSEINTGRKIRVYDEDSLGISQMRIMELVSKTFTRIKDSEREAFLSSFLSGIRVLNPTPESVSGDGSPDLDLDSIFERAIECDIIEGKMRADEAATLFADFAKLKSDEWGPWIEAACRCSQEDVTAVVQKLQRGGDNPDFNSFVYATASVMSIRQAFYPLDSQVEVKVLGKIQVLLRKIPTIPELWKRLSGKREKLFPEDFQESMCKLGLNLSKMEILLFFCMWDEDGDGFLSERELVLMMPVDMIEMKFRNMVKKKIEKDNTSLQGIFRFFDKDGEGKISCEEFTAGCKVLQIGILDSQAVALFKNWDADGGGTIEFEEFKKFMKKE